MEYLHRLAGCLNAVKTQQNHCAEDQSKIEISDYFLFLATDNSMKSRWCPWEIGFADGKKKFNDIFIVPTSSSISTYGSEYLQLYRRIDFSKQGNIAAWVPGSSAGIRVANL